MVYRNTDFAGSYDDVDQATYGGVATKTIVLLGIIAVIAMYYGFSFNFEDGTMPSGYIGVLIGAPILAFIMVIMTHRMPHIAMFTSIIYAICEGLFLGFISAIYSAIFQDQIVSVALMATFGVLFVMLFLYTTGVIRVGNYFRRFMRTSLISFLVISLIMVGLSFTSIGVGIFNSMYLMIAVIGVILASLYLLMDFDQITRYVDGGAPKQTEWALSLGLVVSLVWLYVELLRIIAIIASRARD
jgi:uncharacterized YccA/Bax inhibitor family protein